MLKNIIINVILILAILIVAWLTIARLFDTARKEPFGGKIIIDKDADVNNIMIISVTQSSSPPPLSPQSVVPADSAL